MLFVMDVDPFQSDHQKRKMVNALLYGIYCPGGMLMGIKFTSQGVQEPEAFLF